MLDPWEIGGFRGWGEKPNIKPNRQKKRSKNLKNLRNQKNRIFFTENGLKCIRNLTKHL